MKKQITTAEVFTAIGFALVVYGVGRLHVESALILAGVLLALLGVLMAGKSS